MKKISGETMGAVWDYLLQTAPEMALPVKKILAGYGIETDMPVVEMTERSFYVLFRALAGDIDEYDAFVICRRLAACANPAIMFPSSG